MKVYHTTVAKFIKTENRMLITKGWRRGNEELIYGYIVSNLQDKVLEFPFPTMQIYMVLKGYN